MIARLLPLVALACSSPALSVRAEPELTWPTMRAAEAWNRALDRGPCGEVGLYMTRATDADVLVVAGYAFGSPGFTEDRLIRIDLSLNRFPGLLTTTIAHELGHALGSDHTDVPEDLMFHSPPLRRGPEPTGYDVARVCAYYWEGI